MNIRKNCRKSQFRYLEKGALKLYWAATTKPRQIERSVFFYWTTTDKLKFVRCAIFAEFRQNYRIFEKF